MVRFRGLNFSRNMPTCQPHQPSVGIDSFQIPSTGALLEMRILPSGIDPTVVCLSARSRLARAASCVVDSKKGAGAVQLGRRQRVAGISDQVF